MKCCEYGPRPTNGFIRPLVPHEYLIKKVQLPVSVTRGQCYIANTVVIYSHLIKLPEYFKNIEFAVEWQ